MTQGDAQEIPLAVAAIRLEKSWSVTYRLILTGKLEGRQRENGRWYVGVPSLERLLSQDLRAA